ncbi:MAG: response regulator transcription factor [Comamonadaceae bacterium]|nr:response regulator transcription factor [Comamonadaceae bacterium]
MRAYIIEDNPTIRENLVGTLEELAGVKSVGFSETEGQGAQWLQDHRDKWDVVIVDLFLKQGSGLGVIEACKQRDPRQRVIVLTNYATPDIRTRCYQLGADAVFDKSTDIDSLIDFCVDLGGVN